jgi:hypothetical protein
VDPTVSATVPSIEWRREPDEQHTGSVELRGVSGTPFLYVHPHDQADAPRGSCAAWWWYNNRDTTESPVAANQFSIYVSGNVSYAAYFQTRDLYRSRGGWTRFAIWAVTNSYRLQEAPGEVLGAPIATTLQASGSCAYEAYLVFDPPPPNDIMLQVDAELWAHARGECTPRAAIGMGRAVSADAKVYDHTGSEIERANALAQIQAPRASVYTNKTASYPVAVVAGTAELHLGSVIAGPGYSIGSGESEFTAFAEIAFTVTDANGTVLLEPPSDLPTDDE